MAKNSQKYPISRNLYPFVTDVVSCGERRFRKPGRLIFHGEYTMNGLENVNTHSGAIFISYRPEARVIRQNINPK